VLSTSLPTPLTSALSTFASELPPTWHHPVLGTSSNWCQVPLRGAKSWRARIPARTIPPALPLPRKPLLR
jgi:hypothetical protein